MHTIIIQLRSMEGLAGKSRKKKQTLEKAIIIYGSEGIVRH